jgi:hypothetical protein
MITRCAKPGLNSGEVSNTLDSLQCIEIIRLESFGLLSD